MKDATTVPEVGQGWVMRSLETLILQVQNPLGVLSNFEF